MESKNEDREQVKNKTYRRQPKPPLSYITMIAMAIRDSPGQRATLNEIHRYLMRKFQFFQGSYRGWKDSVRHNLSCNSCFVKELKDPARPWGKGNYWRLSETDQYVYHNGIVQKKKHKRSLATEEKSTSLDPNAPKKLRSESSVSGCFVPVHPYRCNFGMNYSVNYLHENLQTEGNYLKFRPSPFLRHSSTFAAQPIGYLQQDGFCFNPRFKEHCGCFGNSSQFGYRCFHHHQHVESSQKYVPVLEPSFSSSRKPIVERSVETEEATTKFSSSFSIDSLLEKDQ